MLQSLQIENLRGIAKGSLEGFAPLTILTGPNGCGKSTVLDALLIGLAKRPAEGVARVVRRRPRLVDGARWLVGEPGREAEVALQVSFRSRPSNWKLHWRRLGGEEVSKEIRSSGPPFSAIEIREGLYDDADELIFAGDGHAALKSKNRLEGDPEYPTPFFVDPGLPLALDELFSDAVRQGRRREVQDFLRELVPSLETLEILKEKDERSQLYVVTATGAIPVAVSGDGVQSFAQLAIELAAIPQGIALVEEPEVYQHPRAIWQTALAILTAVQRGVHVVLTTHSLELIDAILGQASPTGQKNIALFNLALEGGQLRSSRSSGEQLLFARRTLEHDLR